MKAKGSKNIVTVVRDALEPVISGLGYRLWDLEYVKEGADYYLRFTIDSDNGITIDDCEKVHRTIDPLLDELDPIEGAYNLQVSSPGLERDVKYEWHYAELIGEKLELRLFAPLEEYPGKKSFTGVLRSLEDGVITLDDGAQEYRIPFASVSRAKTVYDF